MKTQAKPETKSVSFKKRIEKLIKYVDKDGPDTERLLLAIREGLLVGGGRGHQHRGGALDHFLGLARLVEIAAGRTKERNDIERVPSPEDALAYLAFAFERLEEIADAVSLELQRAETDNAARTRRVA